MEEQDKIENNGMDNILEMYEESIKKGTEYHKLIAQFCMEHPEIKKIVNDELPYIIFDILKVAGNSETFAMILALDKKLTNEVKSAISAAFVQGYYRCYQKIMLENMEKKVNES